MREFIKTSYWLDEIKALAINKNIESLWKNLKHKLMEVRNKFVPKKCTPSTPSWKSKNQYPLSKITRKAIKEKNRLHRKWMSSTMEEEATKLRLDYSKVRNKVKALVRKDKRNFERGIALNAKLKPKLFWAHIRKRLKTKVGVAPLLEDPEDKNSLVFDDKKKANLLQKQFSSVFTREPLEDIPSIEKRTRKSIRNVQITVEMVNKKLKELNTNKSCGPDDIHPKLLFELADVISEPLSILLNISIKNESIPREWKKANITPVFKKG